MEPIRETREALDEYVPFLLDEKLGLGLRQRSERVAELVPECVGLSVAYHDPGVTFTVVATDLEIAQLDGLQYVDDGPCVEAVRAGEVIEFDVATALDEDLWLVFARGTAAAGIASTLTLPVMAGAVAVGSINLYASTATAFRDRHEELAEVFGAWAPGAIANADLAFATRGIAEQAPTILEEQTHVEVALGFLMASGASSLDAARGQLHDAALRAGITMVAMARAIIRQATEGPTSESGGSVTDEP